jgi:hypothetical protein
MAQRARTAVSGKHQIRGHRSRRGLRVGDPHPGLLPNAQLVVDHFHLTKLANDALTKLRRRVTWQLHDRRGRKIDPQALATTVDTWWPQINAFPDHRHHQRPHRGLQPVTEAGQTRWLRVPQSAQLGPPDTISLHPQTAGRNPDFILIARSKSKSRHTSLTDQPKSRTIRTDPVNPRGSPDLRSVQSR